MLINSLHAENFRKYEKLEIDDIPQNGVITVAGLNESGKTSIGEAICFALYGRTFVLDEKNLHKVVAWGSDRAEVILKFSDGENDNYTLTRSIDRDKVCTVLLVKENDQDTLLDTEEKVSNALAKILGFDYDAFANSFYLAQRELTTPEPQSNTIKKMAGIGDYARLHDEFLETNDEKAEKISELNPVIKKNQTQLDAMKLDETWLLELVDAEQILGSEQKQREATVGLLDDRVNDYEHNSEIYYSAKKRQSTFGVLSLVLFPIAIILGLLWVGVTYFSASLQGVLSKLNGSTLSTFTTFTTYWLLPLAVISAVAFFVSVFVKLKAKATMEKLNGEAEEIVNIIQEGHDHITTEVNNLLPERVVQSLQERSDAETILIIPPREQFANLRQLIADAPHYIAKPVEVTAAISRLSSAIKKQDGDIEDLSKELLEDISQEKVRSDEAGVLRSTVKTLTNNMNECQRNIEVNNISIGILERAAVNSIDMFNKNIERISADTLPKFTEGRYSKMRIAEDFSVKVYSDDKRDYMDFDEISSGTQRQIMLALRMAMSEELATNTGNNEQFIFLDEPFAFFDHKRTVSTLRALPDVSKVITQVWVVSQEFPEEVKVKKEIICSLESTTLII